MPKFSKGHNSGKIRWFFFKSNQVIFSRYLADKISFWFFQKGITPEREITWTTKKLREAIYDISKPQHARFIRHGMHQISFWFFQRGITPEREITRTEKKPSVSYFSLRDPYMKFQNPSIHGFWWTDGWMHNPKPICPVNFFEVGGIKNCHTIDRLFQIMKHLQS